MKTRPFACLLGMLILATSPSAHSLQVVYTETVTSAEGQQTINSHELNMTFFVDWTAVKDEPCLGNMLEKLLAQWQEEDNQSMAREVREGLALEGLDLDIEFRYSKNTSEDGKVQRHKGTVGLIGTTTWNKKVKIKLANQAGLAWLTSGGIWPNNPNGLSVSDICTVDSEVVRRILELSLEQEEAGQIQVDGMALGDFRILNRDAREKQAQLEAARKEEERKACIAAQAQAQPVVHLPPRCWIIYHSRFVLNAIYGTADQVINHKIMDEYGRILWDDSEDLFPSDMRAERELSELIEAGSCRKD